MKKRLVSLLMTVAMLCGFAGWFPTGYGGSSITAYAISETDVVSWMSSKNGTTINDGGTQCVAAFNSYLRLFGISNPIGQYPVSGARQIFDYDAPAGWQKIYGSGDYRVGDVVIWNGNVGKGWGHVGIVYSTSGTVQIFDQNWVTKNQCGIHNISSEGSISGVFRPFCDPTEPPKWAKVSIDYPEKSVGENITFELSSDTGRNFTVGIDDADGNRIDTYDTELDEYSYTRSFDKPGIYSCYITAYNNYGLCDSDRIYFIISDGKPSFARVSLDKVEYDVGEDVTFKLSTDTGRLFSIGINNANGDRIDTYDTEWYAKTYTRTFNEPGNYSCYVTTYNDHGLCDSERIFFNITEKNKKPGYAKVVTDKYCYNTNSEVIFTMSSDTGNNYTIGINDQDGNRIDTYDTDFFEYTYKRKFGKPGDYSCYVTTYNSYGLADSERIYFNVYDDTPIDLGDDFIAKITTTKNNLDIAINEEYNVIVDNSSNDKSHYWHFYRMDDGSYKIRNLKGGVMDLDDFKDDDGANITAWGDNGGDNQRWFIFWNGKNYYISPKCCPDKFIDVYGGHFKPGDNICSWAIDGTNAERFNIIKEDLCEHTYGEPEWIWNDDYNVSAKFTCEKCGEVQTAEAVVTSKTTAPTYTSNSKTVYTATVTIGDKTYTTTKTVILDKLTYTAPTITFKKGDGAVKLTWEAVPGAEKYAVCGYIGNKWQKLAESESTSYVLNDLKAGKEYTVAIIAKTNGNWSQDFSNAIVVTPKAEEISKYPKVTDIEYSEQYHQFRLTWNAVDGATEYGIAVKLGGKWKIQAYTEKTYYTSPKLKEGSTAEMVICAKVNGKWDTSKLLSRTFTVTVK